MMISCGDTWYHSQRRWFQHEYNRGYQWRVIVCDFRHWKWDYYGQSDPVYHQWSTSTLLSLWVMMCLIDTHAIHAQYLVVVYHSSGAYINRRTMCVYVPPEHYTSYRVQMVIGLWILGIAPASDFAPGTSQWRCKCRQWWAWARIGVITGFSH